MINRLSILSFCALALSTSAFAAIPLTIDNSYSTGYTPTTEYPNSPVGPGSPLGAGTSDLFFNLYSAYPAPSTEDAIVVPQIDNGPGWVTAAGAQWIGPVEDESGNSSTSNPTPVGGLAGVYDYSADFSSNFLNPMTVTMTGLVSADNIVTITINGNPVETLGATYNGNPLYTQLVPISFTFTVDAKESIIPIDFVVDNLANGGSQSTNPTGLLISNLQFTSTASPEPSTWVLLIGGAAALVALHRRRLAAIL